MVKFQDYLCAHGITCTIRQSKGLDISAACGQLKQRNEKNKILAQNSIDADKISSAKTRGRAGANEPTNKISGRKDQVLLTNPSRKTGPESAATTQNLTNVEKK